jgi:hypothetical protein
MSSENFDENGEKKYPLSDFYTYVDGFDIVRTGSKIVAIVIVAQGSQKSMRLYAWRKKGEDWKVDLARMDATRWNWQEINEKVSELKTKYSLS